MVGGGRAEAKWEKLEVHLERGIVLEGEKAFNADNQDLGLGSWVAGATIPQVSSRRMMTLK